VRWCIRQLLRAQRFHHLRFQYLITVSIRLVNPSWLPSNPGNNALLTLTLIPAIDPLSSVA